MKSVKIMSSLNELKVESKRGRPSKPLALTLEEGSVDVFEGLCALSGRPLESSLSVCKDVSRESADAAKAAAAALREAAKAEKDAAKAALREAAKAEKDAAKAALREAAKAEKAALREAAKEAKRLEKDAARDAAKAAAAALREAAKAEKAAAREAAKEAAKAEKAAAREAAKAEKAAAREAAKAEKAAAREAKKPAPQLVAALQRADEPVPELQVEGYEEEEEVCVRVFEHNGKRWLRDDGGAIYDPESHDEVGRWDEKSQSVVAMKMPTEPRMMCDNA
jgi:hypothetical protein